MSVWVRVLFLAVPFLSTYAVSASSREMAQSSQAPVRYHTSAYHTTPTGTMRPSLRTSVADTLHLAWFGFPSNNKQGWTSVDKTAQIDSFFHVAGSAELDGGLGGNLRPLEGTQSMWCGVASALGDPFCGWAALPGYGNLWEQTLVSKPLACDSIRLCYRVFWDSEAGYDETRVEYFNDLFGTWTALPVNSGAGSYTGTGQLDECFVFTVPGDTTRLRFRFNSDSGFSDEDGLLDTDGAVTLDSITVDCYNGGVVSTSWFEDFEGETPGARTTDDGRWSAETPAGFGDFAALYSDFGVIQEDPCFDNSGFFWGFFDSPLNTDYTCGGFPQQGAIPFHTFSGLYMENEIWSPPIPFTGTGDEVRLRFRVYRDLPIDNLVFYIFRVRSWQGSCPGPWRDSNVPLLGAQKDWFLEDQSIGSLIEAGATQIQISLATLDLCRTLCGVLGTGICHSHAPLFDDVHVVRIQTVGPQFNVRHIDLFQDTFAADGTVTGHARADAANDIALSANPSILPGDSISITVSDPSAGLATDPSTGVGPAVYAWVTVWPAGQAGKSGQGLEAPETRAGGARYPLVDSLNHDGVTWYQFRMDTCITPGGTVLTDRFCFDLNDTALAAGDTLAYIFSAKNTGGIARYWSRRLDGQGVDFASSDVWEALSSPCEFTILPAGGFRNGGNILYVDAADDRDGPPQLAFDSAFQILNLIDRIDRFDVLGPSSNAGNSLSSRVTNAFVQICDTYGTIIWNSGNLERGLIGDGTGNPEKSDDYGLLFQFLDVGPNNPGVYLSGDNIAEEWAGLQSAGAVNMKSVYTNFNVINSDHVDHGQPVSPLLKAVGSCFIHAGGPDSLIAAGGCPAVNDFDVLQATGLAQAEFMYPNLTGAAVISQTTTNAVGTTARVILSGFSYHYIRDPVVTQPPTRVEHLSDILVWLQSVVPSPTGIDPSPLFANYLGNNYPNPFNPTTTIRFGLAEPSHVTLKIYNVAGQLVRTLVDEELAPRPEGFETKWDGRGNGGQPVASGVYFYRLSTKNFARTKKLVVLK